MFVLPITMLLDPFFLANNLKIGWLKVQYYCERFLSYLGIEQTIGYMCDSTDIISRERQERFTLHFFIFERCKEY